MKTSSNRVVWTGNRCFDAFDQKDRCIKMDASATYGGTDTAPSPMDLLLMGLSGCTGIVLTIAMEDMEAGMETLEIRAEGTRSEEPGDYAQMKVIFEAKGGKVSHETMQKALLDYVLPKAPVLCTLSRSCPISMGYALDGQTMIMDAETGGFRAANNA